MPDMNAPRDARPVLLARRRADAAGEGDRTVHLVPTPLGGQAGAVEAPCSVEALCGIELLLGEIETVAPGEGVWCSLCFVVHVTGCRPAPVLAESVTCAEQESAAAAYRKLGWPVTVRGTFLSLNLDLDVDAVALVIPVLLATDVVEILVRRRCSPAVLVHPAVPTHRIVLAGERFGVPLGWTTGVHRVTGTLVLPPSVTVHGPVQWIRPPGADSLRRCREFDVAAALHTALSDPRTS